MDFIDEAQGVVDQLIKNDEGRFFLTTSQIRKFLSAVNVINNKVMVWEMEQNAEQTTLSNDLSAEIRYLKVKLIYQAKEKSVKDFIEKAKLLEKIDKIGDNLGRYREFAKFVEAVVAYHKFEGGN